MSDVLNFAFNSQTIRVVDSNGDPWFVAKDVCDILTIRVDNAMNCLSDAEKGHCGVVTPGGMQTVRIISESGLYKLIMRSDKPLAKPFQDWACGAWQERSVHGGD